MSKLTLKLSRKFEFLSFRQKIIVCVGLLVGLYVFWNILINESVVAFRAGVVEQSKVLRYEILQINAKINTASEAIKNNPKEGLSQKIFDAKKTSDELDEKIHARTVNMVSPKEMNAILSKVIQKSEGLAVLKIQSIEKKLLVQIKKSNGVQIGGAKNGRAKSETPKNDGVPGDSFSKNDSSVFEHGILLEMSGGYFDTLNFLKSLEKYHLSVVWDAIDYEVLKYPKASIKIVMHTLSLDEDFIGV